jgi:flagellar export protein FliJ
MTRQHLVKSLGTLVDLRGREVDRLSAEMAEKAAVRARFHANLARMQGLCAGGVVQGGQPMALAMNRAGYKQALLHMVAEHQQDLALHEADMAVTQRALTAAAQKREVLGQVLTQQREQVQMEHGKREQKHQDDLAAQVWWRGQA